MKLLKSITQIERYQEIITILIKNGYEELIHTLGAQKYLGRTFVKPKPQNLQLSRVQRIRKTVEELGPTYIKLAQILSIRPDLIPLELSDEFTGLQDQVKPLAFDKISPLFLEEFGKNSDELFIDKLELIASASIGQVYKATLKNGDIVAIKVQKPNIKETIFQDMEIMRHLASLLSHKLREFGIDDGIKIVDEFEKTIKKELDYTIEAQSLKRFSKNFQDHPLIKVPKLYEELSSKKILTMEYIDGIKITDLKSLENAGLDKKESAQKGFALICEQIFKHRFFHADPHPGNIFVLRDGRIAFLDFGMMGNIGHRDRENFVELIYYVVKNEEEKAALSLLKLAKVENTNLDTDLFAKEMGDIISTYFYGSLKEISLKALLEDIIILMSRYKVYFREDNYLLTKAIIIIEGVGQKLEPSFKAVEEIKPFIIDFYKENRSFGAMLKKLSDLPKDISDFFSQFPQDLNFIIQKIKKGELKIEFEHVGLQELEHSIEKSFNRLAISVIIASILIGSSLVLLAQTPPLLYGMPVLGIIGFSIAFLMGIVLVFSIYKRGKL